MIETRSTPRFLLVVIGLSFAAPAAAIDWQASKGFEVGATHSDNADTSDGEDGGESVLSFSPFVRLDGRGRRSDLSLDARFELRRFVEEERDEFAPELSFASRTTLVERLVDLDASARISQRSSAAEPLVGEELIRFDETVEVYEIAVGPTIGAALGDRARYDAAYRIAASRSSDDTVAGSEVQAASFRLLGLANAETVLTVGGEYEVARFEDGGDDARAGRVGLGLGHRFRPTLTGLVSTGYDQVDAGDAEGSVDGSFWAVGARWEPNARLAVRAGYGERAYGRRPTASITLSGRRSTLELAWARELAFARGTSLTDDLLSPPGTGAGGGVGAPGDTDTVGAGNSDSGIDTGDLPSDAGAVGAIDGDETLAPLGRDAGSIDETVDLRYALTGRRSILSASIGWARRERLDDDQVSEGIEYGLGLERTLSRRTEAAIGWTVIENEVLDESSRTRENRVRLTIRVAL